MIAFALTQWKKWLAIACTTLAASLFALISPWPMSLLIDHVLMGKELPGWATSFGKQGLVGLLASSGVLIYLIDTSIHFIITRGWIIVGQKLVYDLSEKLFAHVQRRSVIYHSKANVGDLLSRITGDSWCVYNLASAALFTPAQAIIMLGVILAVLWPMNPHLTLVALTITPLQAICAIYFGSIAHRTRRAERDSESHVESHIQQTLAGIPVVQTFAQENREMLKFAELTGAALRTQRRSAILGGIVHIFSGGISATGSAVVLALAGREVIAGRMTLGHLQLFVAYQGMLYGEISQIVSVYSNIQSARASVDRTMELLEEPIEICEPANPATLSDHTADRSLELKHVYFGYDPNHHVLQDISLSIPHGETLAIVGPSGSGKSTLSSLLLRLIDPQSGEILLNNIDLRQLRLIDIRQTIAVVPQESILMPLTVTENLLYSNPNADSEELFAATRAACAHELIEALDEGYDTILGEMGTTLSGGQRQRLAIARALVRNAEILILDEPTSALDAETEQRVIQNILHYRQARGQTTMLITHRFSTAAKADRIVVMNAGKIVESGSYKQLLENRGLFSRLHHLQTSSAEQEVMP